MANIIKPKRSAVAAKVPTTAQMVSGEIAVNSTDQKIYTYDGTNILLIGSGKLSGLADVTLTSLTSGQGLSWNGTAWVNSNAGTGSVTSVSVVSANGFAGTVATATSTPAITLSTSITGLLKGNGTAISAAVSGTDYAPATSGSAILYGNAAGGFSSVTVGTGLSFTAGTLAATNAGTVTSVTGTAPVVSSGGTTPAISMAAATTSVNGYLTSTDWNTFNGKQAALGFTPYNSTNPNNYIALASAITGYTVGTNTALAATDTLLAGLGKIQGQINARGTGNGTVTSVGGTGTVVGLTLTGTVTSSGSLTLGGTFALPTGQVTTRMIYDNFTATAAQTIFTTSVTYTSGKMDVFCNGIKMVNGTDVTVTSGTSVVFATGLAVGTLVNLVYPT